MNKTDQMRAEAEKSLTYRIKFFIIQLGEYRALDLLRFQRRPVENGQAELGLDLLLDCHSCTQRHTLLETCTHPLAHKHTDTVTRKPGHTQACGKHASKSVIPLPPSHPIHRTLTPITHIKVQFTPREAHLRSNLSLGSFPHVGLTCYLPLMVLSNLIKVDC